MHAHDLHDLAEDNDTLRADNQMLKNEIQELESAMNELQRSHDEQLSLKVKDQDKIEDLENRLLFSCCPLFFSWRVSRIWNRAGASVWRITKIDLQLDYTWSTLGNAGCGIRVFEFVVS